MDGEIGRTQVRSILMLAAVFVVLLPILLGSVRLGLLGILINGLPLMMTFGLMGLLGSRLNMATALIGGVAIGSTVNSTLFFINRFQAELARGRAWTDAIEAAVRGIGDGILITTGILAGGFLCMTVSSFKPTADFGIFTCFTIMTGAFLDIVIDPILLGFMAPRGGAKGPARSVHHPTSPAVFGLPRAAFRRQHPAHGDIGNSVVGIAQRNAQRIHGDSRARQPVVCRGH